MEILIALGLPLLIGLGVFAFFWRDLRYFQHDEKFKVGDMQALEALVQRHAIAMAVHFALLLIGLPLMIFMLEAYALIGAILLAAVFLGHVSALNRLSRPLIAALRYQNERHEEAIRLTDEADEEQFEAAVQNARERVRFKQPNHLED